MAQGLYRQVFASFWSDPKIADTFSPEDKFFYLYLMTNEHSRQCGIYQISLKQIAFDTGYSNETVRALIDRFERHLGRIKYNPETYEMCVINWAKYNYPEKTGDNRLGCIAEELAQVKDRSLVDLVVANACSEVQNVLCEKWESEARPAQDKPLASPSIAPCKGLISPSVGPMEPLGEEKEEEREQEKEGGSRAREAALPSAGTCGAIPQPMLPAEIPHFAIASAWFKRFNQATGLTTQPDERCNLAAKKLLEFLGGDLRLAMQGVEYYFNNWQDLWFACEKKSRSGARETRQWEFRFGSFANPENFQEILSRMKSTPVARKEQENWSSAAPPVPDDELATPDEVAAVLGKIGNLRKGVEVVA